MTFYCACFPLPSLRAGPSPKNIYVYIFFFPFHHHFTSTYLLTLSGHMTLLLFCPFSLFVPFSSNRPRTLYVLKLAPLRSYSHSVYPSTTIRIPVACYIIAYQLFCQFLLRVPNEWDFFLCFFYYFVHAVLELLVPTETAVSFKTARPTVI